jgi:4-carboxymuconolactone decarboxylase
MNGMRTLTSTLASLLVLGAVPLDVFAAEASSPYSGAYVTFEPGARSNWHTHPAGQNQLITAGVGLTQEWDGPVIEVRAGDHVWCPPGVKHWHGASSPGRRPQKC